MTRVRRLITFLLITLTLVSAACESDFYLSESETAVYASLLSNEGVANNFVFLRGETLNLRFNNSAAPLTLIQTNLLTLMREKTTLGVIEVANRQINSERLSNELQKQIARYVQNELSIYQGNNNDYVKLTRLDFIDIYFVNNPTFTYRPERQAIAFNVNIRMSISGTVGVVLPIIGENSYPLVIRINDLNLNGEAVFNSAFADASQISLKINPTVGTVRASDRGSSSSSSGLKTKIEDFLKIQFSQQLSETFTQRYDYFSVTGLSLAKDTAQPRGTLRYSYNALPETTKPMMHIVARAADGKLYHQRKTEGGQNIISSSNPFPSVQTRIENEPALYASAADQLELAATTVNGLLVFAHWRDEKWGLQNTIVPPVTAKAFSGKPAIIASAPGQVEIVVAGLNGGLWHVRRLNGVWSTPRAVPVITLPNYRTAPYRHPVAALAGNKMVVAFIDNQNRLNASAFDLESGLWGQATTVQTANLLNPNFAPTIAASGDGQVELVYVAANGTPFHRILVIDAPKFRPNVGQTGISIRNNEINIGGNLNAAPILVCSGLKQLELIGRGTDNRLYHNHFVGPNSPGGFIDGRTISQGWQGWSGMSSRFSGTAANANMSSFTAAATGTGKIGVVSITQPTPIFDNSREQYLHYNTFDSLRYGRQPWKTVQWRGIEQIQSRRFVGQPALSMIDQNISLSYINNNSNSFQQSRLTETNIIRPTANTTIGTNVISAEAVSSIPNSTDLIVVGNDLQIRHYRCLEGSPCTIRLLPVTTFRNYRNVAIVGYGNGYLDAVATTGGGRAYHWRYQNGSWSNAVEIISPTMFAEPIAMVNLGSGQLAIVFVNRSNNHPMVGYFSNGAWSAPRALTNFAIENSFFDTRSVKSWGDGTFDYAVVRRQTRNLWQGRAGPKQYTGNLLLGNVTPGRAAVNLGGIINDVPVLTVFSPTRMNIIAEGTNDYLYSNWSRADNSPGLQSTQSAPPILWSGYGNMAGNNLKISDVIKIGANEMVVIGVDSNRKLSVSRFNGAIWHQFQPILTSSPISTSNNYPPLLTNY